MIGDTITNMGIVHGFGPSHCMIHPVDVGQCSLCGGRVGSYAYTPLPPDCHPQRDRCSQCGAFRADPVIPMERE